MVPYVLIAPAILYYAAFWLFPVVRAVVGGFRTAEGVFSLQNYAEIFQDPVFYEALLNTAIIVVLSVALEFVAAFGIALLINRKFKGSTYFLFVAIVPMALPSVAVGAIWTSGFTTYGWLNSFLNHVGLIAANEKIAFLAGSDASSLLLIVIIDAWHVIPLMLIIILAGMQNLDPSFNEAGLIFGGNKWQVLTRITIPMLKQTITTALILRLISALQIWLIIVMLFGFRRLPVLVQEVVYFVEESHTEHYFQIGLAYSVLVAVFVSIVSIVYLNASGAFKTRGSA